MEFNKLIELDRLAKASVSKYSRARELYNELLADSGKHFVGIIGPRGVGKTVVLKQLARTLPNSFYISMESFSGKMFDTLKELKEKLKIQTIFLDEVHSYDDFNKEIQSVYELLDVKVFFTSSTALAMEKSKSDLSRRLMVKYLYPFSLREYIEFKTDEQIPELRLDTFLNAEISPKMLRYGEHFYPYLKGGLMPFALEEPDVIPLLKNILNTVIHKDIPRISTNIDVAELAVIEKLVKFISLSSVDGINYSSVAKNLGITKYKAEQYISLLQQAFILQVVLPEGRNVLREPKVLLSLPYRLLYHEFDFVIGGLREDFVVQTCQALGEKIAYLKSVTGSKTPDFMLLDRDVVLEVGGKGKGRTQFKGVEADRKIILADAYSENSFDKKPLFVLGLVTK